MKLTITLLRRVEVELADGERPVIQVHDSDFTVVSVLLFVTDDGTEQIHGEITVTGFWEKSRRLRSGDKVLSTRLHPSVIPRSPLEPVVANMLSAR